MSRQSQEQYESLMFSLGDDPLRHTVIFESVDGAEKPINQAHELVLAIGGLSQVPGVQGRVIAAQSLNSPNVVEELTVKNAAALQALRYNPDHSKVLAVAKPNTNWLAIDRVAPETADMEPHFIRRERGLGRTPVMRHVVLALPDDVSEKYADDWYDHMDSVMFAAYDDLVVVPEVATSLDKRKGELIIARSVWSSLRQAVAFTGAAVYSNLMSDINDEGLRILQATHTLVE